MKKILENILQIPWNKALAFCVANATVYFLLSILLFYAAPSSVALISSVSLLFLTGSLAGFIFFIRSGGILAPITWFTLGGGIFFGFGNIVGNFHVDPYARTLFGSTYNYMLKNNVINSTTVLIVVLVAGFFSHSRLDFNKAQVWGNSKAILEKLLKLLVPTMLLVLLFKFYNMGTANNLVLLGTIQKISKLLISTAFLSGLLWLDLKKPLRIAVCAFLLTQIGLGILLLSKYEILVGPTSFIVGLLCRNNSLKLKLTSVTIVFGIFYIINPLITLSRQSSRYAGIEVNTSHDRLMILQETVQCYTFKINCNYYPQSILTNLKIADDPLNKPTDSEQSVEKASFGTRLFNRFRNLALRFDTATVQGFLTNKYESGLAGKSLATFWEVFIPRLFWNEKPDVSRFGKILYSEMYNVPDLNDVKSNVAPTFNAESYWNYGFTGVLIASLVFGLIIGFTNLIWKKAMSGQFDSYFLFAMHIALWAMYIESWFVATILGEILIILSMMGLMHFGLKFLNLIFVKRRTTTLAINS